VNVKCINNMKVAISFLEDVQHYLSMAHDAETEDIDIQLSIQEEIKKTLDLEKSFKELLKKYDNGEYGK